MPTPIRFIPALPSTIKGVPVDRWSPWKKEMILSHIDPGCDTCADPGPGCIAIGYARTIDKGRPVELRRWHAHRCAACDEMRIYERNITSTFSGTGLVLVLYCPPRTQDVQLLLPTTEEEC